MRITSESRKQWKKKPAGGFTAIQLVITVSVVAIVSALAAYGIRTARASMRLANDTRQLASYLEKARADSVRRNARPGSESSVQIVDRKTYIVTMGFGGSDTVTSQTFTLSDGVEFGTDPLTITFNWRGRPTTGGELAISLQNSIDPPSQIDVTGSGDVTVGSEIFQDDAIPDVNLNSNVSGGDDVASDPGSNINGAATPTPTPDPHATPTPTPEATPTPTPTPFATPTPTPTPKHGNPNEDPTPTPTPSVTPTPTPTPDQSACRAVATPSAVAIGKNGGSASITIKLTLDGSGSISASTAATNLKVAPSSQTLTEGGEVIFTVISLDNTRGNFTVTFSTPCGTQNVTVSVTN